MFLLAAAHVATLASAGNRKKTGQEEGACLVPVDFKEEEDDDVSSSDGKSSGGGAAAPKRTRDPEGEPNEVRACVRTRLA